jgi:hypothetical protein
LTFGLLGFSLLICCSFFNPFQNQTWLNKICFKCSSPEHSVDLNELIHPRVHAAGNAGLKIPAAVLLLKKAAKQPTSYHKVMDGCYLIFVVQSIATRYEPRYATCCTEHKAL